MWCYTGHNLWACHDSEKECVFLYHMLLEIIILWAKSQKKMKFPSLDFSVSIFFCTEVAPVTGENHSLSAAHNNDYSRTELSQLIWVGEKLTINHCAFEIFA